MAKGESTPPPGSSGTHVVRNILVSVTSTVLGASIIYFLGFHNRGGNRENDFLVVKEATTAGWRSYTAYENAYAKNMMTYEKAIPETGIDPYLEGFKKESEKLQHDVGELIKRKSLDKDLVTVLERRLENEKQMIPKYEAYLANLKRILADTTVTPKVKQDNYVAEETRWLNYYKGAFERAVNDIQEIGKTLTERYGQQFSVNDILVVQSYEQRVKTADSMINVIRNLKLDVNTDTTNRGKPVALEFVKNIRAADVTGKWYTDGAVITLLKNGKTTWVVDTANKASGTWKIEANKLRMDVVIEKTKKKFTWRFLLAQITKESFTMATDGENQLIYNLVRLPG